MRPARSGTAMVGTENEGMPSTDASNDTITFASTGSTEQSAVFKEYLYVATSSQTTFSGSDANSDTLSYTVGFLEVHLNGVKLRPTTDFTASNGTSVVLAEAASTNHGTFCEERKERILVPHHRNFAYHTQLRMQEQAERFSEMLS